MTNSSEKEKTVKTPSTMKVIWQEFRHDRVAMASLIFTIVLILGIFIYAASLNLEKVTNVNIFAQYDKPGQDGFILGADEGGRDGFKMLVIGARNSITIGFAVTIISSIFGIVYGMISGFYGGWLDNGMMRIYDFINILPEIMIIIVLVTIIPKYNAGTFIIIMSCFMWLSTARLIRSKALSESEKDYVAASRTSGTSDFMILFREVLPNLSSIIIVDTTLSFAGNIGIETGLSFLGFGLPDSTPSLGTLISYAQDPDVIGSKAWVWLPAAIVILVLTLSISYVGQALRRAGDAQQRRG
ncbi:Oligopeptide transport system permease protein OppC [Pediococcus damnosus]|uniref:Oligopeptide transport system permease protein OppC n=1 Tax=Pediococcus damnosus TaxID=51663 RepID=A0A0R2H492_9LACO|nr:ABC transporter permease [Pediococcus damnosus]AMV60951.1 Oligopeptide transport system permease protein OppC [Pediococcus damnosus]AMV63516.1 Oligopeptide transport system permease protein OppC [Pediococcus damnosus]AMV65311.1 Oligopeptide transport system permease protein OppC [Pediococcus damnosus]AMV66546.1 Oligopeptide transport system permease protein OppC [Pediococcus damnosus]AMV68842.1 Oligopeptide transport system permease protein OppC [Pediococcus damnosus]